MVIAMRLDIDSLRAFKTVLDLGGVTRAAEKLHLTQSAVSHKISRLEEKLGRPILFKGPNGLMPTADGSHLLSFANRLVAIHDEAVEFFKRSDLSGEIRLGATEDAIDSKMSAVFGRFRRSNPMASVNIRVAQSLLLNEWLGMTEIDLAIMQVFVHEKMPGDIELWREDLHWVEAALHPFVFTGIVPFVSFDKNSFYGLAAKKKLEEVGIRLENVFECPSREGVKAAVLNGLGVTLLSTRNVTEGLVEIAEGLPKFPQVCHVLRTHSGASGALLKNLIDAVLNEFLETPSPFRPDNQVE
ncbi:LysR family transcriptional regulator [Pseudomonas kermanshahensis]|uniref:LysR family transcriptional regulator n=2 Tax=Pseudomonas TaxID=286 RepID=UPI0023DC2DC5|nr:LysR family transcriptional regulator [Pseudomonas kermanshahensis]WEL57582.1 LysR family transcriptional regulator [Pseudomonas kermanshahensis]